MTSQLLIEVHPDADGWHARRDDLAFAVRTEPEVRQALCVETAPDTETLLRLLDGLREA